MLYIGIQKPTETRSKMITMVKNLYILCIGM